MEESNAEGEIEAYIGQFNNQESMQETHLYLIKVFPKSTLNDSAIWVNYTEAAEYVKPHEIESLSAGIKMIKEKHSDTLS